MTRRLRRRLSIVPILIAGAAVYALSSSNGDGDRLAHPGPAGVSPDPSTGDVLTGRPSRVTDGDTLRFGDVRVRLHGINAPEMDTADGPRARAALIEAIGSDAVRCEDTGQRSYERIVAVCFDARGRDLAERMVRSGWADDWPRYSGGRYALAGLAAKAEGRGVYSR